MPDTLLSPDVWQENLAALQAVNALLAEELAALPIPPHVQPAVGRDQSPTFLIQLPDGQREWFGRTSMPTVSAEGLLKQFKAGTGTVVTAGIGSGLEVKLLGERLGRHRATIVLETDPLNLALALRLWKMKESLQSRRVILLLASDHEGLAQRLAAFCQEHPGLEPPSRMLAWPWRDGSENQVWQNLLTQTSDRVAYERNALRAKQIELLTRSRQRGQSPGAVVVMTTMPDLLIGRAAESLADGAEAAGLETACCWPENPLRAGSLAGLCVAGALAGQGCSVQMILVDACRNSAALGDIPDGLVTWLVTAEDLGENFVPVAGKDDWIVTSTDSQKELLLRKGWSPQRVLAGAPFISPKAWAATDDGPRSGVVLLHDLTPEDPDKAGVTLYSHKVLWQALRERLNSQCDWQPSEASRWLVGAQKATGIDLADAAVQQQFMEIVQRHLAPSILLSRAAKAIREAGLTLRIYGRGWGEVAWAKEMYAGPADDPHSRVKVLRRAQVAILGDIRLGQAHLALEAAAAGAAIMARPLWPGSDPTTLLLPGVEMVVWTGQQELIERLRHLLQNDGSRAEMTQKASLRAIAEHSTSVRLRAILARIGQE